MATQVVMPQMGADMQEGTLVRWIKREGDTVSRGDIIAEIETEKATVELEAFASGVLRKILVHEGTTVPVGVPVAIIGAPDEELPEIEPGRPSVTAEKQTPAEAAVEAEAPATATPVRQAEAVVEEERVRASPIARRMAEEHGIDLRQVRGTGPEGRIVRRDIEEYLRQREAAPPPPPPPPQPEVAPPPPRPEAAPAALPMTRMRQAIARRMTQSKREAPHFYMTVNIDMTEAQRLRRQLNESVGEGVRITVNDMIVKAVATALQLYPQFNAWYMEGRIEPKDRINIGIAIALEEGLIAPAVLDCGSKSLGAIARASADLATRARSGVLKPEEYTEGTFTVSNVGMYGVESMLSIINPPQVAILGVGAVESQPVVREGNVVIADMMKMVLSADHRAVDGALAAQFLRELKSILENPMRLLL